MTQIKLTLTSDSPSLNSVGDIYKSPFTPGDLPEVTDVFARNRRASIFHLEPGTYEYRFYLQDGDGKCTIGIRLPDDGTSSGSKEYDATYSRGNIFVFTISRSVPAIAGGA